MLETAKKLIALSRKTICDWLAISPFVPQASAQVTPIAPPKPKAKRSLTLLQWMKKEKLTDDDVVTRLATRGIKRSPATIRQMKYGPEGAGRELCLAIEEISGGAVSADQIRRRRMKRTKRAV